MKKFLSILSIVLILIASTNMVLADTFKTVSIGADITDTQKQQMYNEFGANPSDVQTVVITNSDERKYLSGIVSDSIIGNRSISCSYVEPLSSGEGLNVTVNNLTFVNKEMIANALVTAGIKDAKVIASAPFSVSGTAALTGIMKAFEKSTGTSLNPVAKDAATREMVATGELGQQIGQEKAAQFVNDVKQEVISAGAKNSDDIKSIIQKVAEKEGINLSDEQINSLSDILKKISTLDIKLSDIQNQLKSINEKLAKGFEETKGILAKIQQVLESIKKAIASLIEKVKSFFA